MTIREQTVRKMESLREGSLRANGKMAARIDRLEQVKTILWAKLRAAKEENRQAAKRVRGLEKEVERWRGRAERAESALIHDTPMVEFRGAVG